MRKNKFARNSIRLNRSAIGVHRKQSTNKINIEDKNLKQERV